jgi:nanoRNase/pAp phosphatase (c-di-AMP/oligoRNAs hydrolase)
VINKESFEKFLFKHKQDKLVISSHRKVDIDGLACALALSKLFPNSVLAFNDLDEGAKGLSQKLNIESVALDELDIAQYSGLIVVDTASYVLLEQARKWKILLVIDHHHGEGRNMEAELMIVDENSPSSAEIVAGLLGDISAEVAYALSAAIISDTARFKAGSADTFETLAKLMKIADAKYPDLLSVAEPELRSDVKMAVLKAFQRVNFIYASGYVIATSEVGSNESDAAQLISDVADVAFVASWKDKEKETRISARARKSFPVALNEVMKEVGESFSGGGGGHPKAAGASAKAHTQEVLKECVELVSLKLSALAN